MVTGSIWAVGTKGRVTKTDKKVRRGCVAKTKGGQRLPERVQWGEGAKRKLVTGNSKQRSLAKGPCCF